MANKVVSEILGKLKEKGIYLTQEITEENLEEILSIYQDVLGVDSGITYQKNDNGYTIYVGETAFSHIESKDTVGDVIALTLGIEQENTKQTKPSRPPRSKINIRLWRISEANELLKTLPSMLSDYKTYLESGKSKLSEELKSKVIATSNSLEASIQKLMMKASLLNESVETSLMYYSLAEEKNYKELEELVNYLFELGDNALTEVSYYGNGNHGDEYIPATVTIEEYMDIYENADAFYSPFYEDAIKEFETQRKIQYYRFLSQTKPEVLNMMIEDIYLRGTSNKVGTKEYQTGLEDFKASFGKSILTSFNIDANYDFSSSPIPETLWYQVDSENNIRTPKSDYERALIAISFSGNVGEDDILSKMEAAIRNYQTEDFSLAADYLDVNQYKNIIATEKFFTESLRDEQGNYKPIDEIINYYNKLLDSFETIGSNSFMDAVQQGFELSFGTAEFPRSINDITQSVYASSLQNADINIQACWVNALKKYGYIEEDNQHTDEEIYRATFNDDYVGDILSSKGDAAVLELLKSFYGLARVSNEDIDTLTGNMFRLDGEINGLRFNTALNKLLNGIASPLMALGEKKLSIDASKANYKMALARALADNQEIVVSEEDYNAALAFLGNNAQYLEDWQIRAYAILENIDTETRVRYILENNPDVMENYSSMGITDVSEIIDYIGTNEGYGKFFEHYTYNPAQDLLDDTYWNIIQSGKGYDYAMNLMQIAYSEGVERAVEQLTNNKELGRLAEDNVAGIISTLYGLGSGTLNSVKGVCRLVTADGKMSAGDYCQSYLRELLGTNYGIYRDYYDVTSANHQRVSDMLLTEYDANILSTYGLNNLDLNKIGENVPLYQVLYAKGIIKDDEYYQYSKLEERRKNDD